MIGRYMSAARQQLSVLKRPNWQHWIVLLLFVFAQTAALLHAEVHEFHEHDASCAVYAVVEHQTPQVVPPIALPSPGYRHLTVTVPMPAWVSFSRARIYWARAPPRLSA
ncbi:MAG: hypothetical protein ACFCUJ_15595 [Thiotrichales bacterium]